MRILPAALLVMFAAGVVAADDKPAVVEESGRKVAVWTVKGKDGVSTTVGDVKYHFPQGIVYPDKHLIRFTVRLTNAGKEPADLRYVFPLSDKWKASTDPAPAPGGEWKANGGGSGYLKRVQPGKTESYFSTFRSADPFPKKDSKSMALEFPAPKGAGVDVWRVVYPRAGWEVKK